MTKQHLRLAGLAAVAGTFAVPAVAAAHPAAWEITPRAIPSGQTPNNTWTQANLVPGPKQVAAYNHNNTKIFVESNGKADGGLLNFRYLPGAYRSQVPKSQWFSEAGTGIQTHDTCEVPALEAESVVLSWQEADPFWTYIPFQPTSAQLDDDPADWIPEVQAATGVNLADPALASASAREAACEALPGATASSFRAADTISSTTNTLFTFLTTPLNERITTVEGQLAAANAATVAAQTAAAAAQAQTAAVQRELDALKLSTSALTVVPATVPSLGTLASDGYGVVLTGPAGKTVQVRLVLSESKRRSLKLGRRVLGSTTATLGNDAKGTATVKLSSAAAKAVRGVTGSLSMKLDGTSGDRYVSQTVTLKK